MLSADRHDAARQIESRGRGRSGGSGGGGGGGLATGVIVLMVVAVVEVAAMVVAAGVVVVVAAVVVVAVAAAVVGVAVGARLFPALRSKGRRVEDMTRHIFCAPDSLALLARLSPGSRYRAHARSRCLFEQTAARPTTKQKDRANSCPNAQTYERRQQ